MELNQLKAGLDLHKVQRFQTYNFTVPKSVAEHSFRVGMLYAYLWPEDESLPAFGHDLEEAITSDIPSPVKVKLTGLKQFEKEYRIPYKDDEQKARIKLVDLLELVLDVREQQELGNNMRKVKDIYEDTLENVMERARKLKKTTEVKRILREMRK